MQVWLPRAFWSLVDSAYLYDGGPGRDLAQAPNSRPLLPENLDQLRLWHSAWFAGLLENAFNWFGDARRESVCPEGTPLDAIERFEYLDGTLGGDDVHQPAGSLDPLSMCGRQAIAVAGALAPDPVVVLTHSIGDMEPDLLRDVQDIRLPGERAAGLEKRSLVPALNTTGAKIALAHLRWIGVTVAAVHVVAPCVTLGHRREERDDLVPDAFPMSDPWRDARLVWHLV
jgi:hypothetical protein